MAERYFDLSCKDRREVLNVAADRSGREVHLLEKDIWVVWCLERLFLTELGKPLVFKGGTSLSKAYNVIRRFSEDIDLTYDIRVLAPEIVGEAPKALPRDYKEGKKWAKKVGKRLETWVADTTTPFLKEALAKIEPAGEVRVEGSNIFVRYAQKASDSDYVRPVVKLEFGARATGMPNQQMQVTCDAEPHVESVQFPNANPRVMSAERTFWEKAIAAHVYCKQGRLRGKRYARHWYDLTRLAAEKYAESAIADSELGTEVANHNTMFFSAKDRDKQKIDYHAAVTGNLQLVPQGDARDDLAKDYARMVEEGLLMDEPQPFNALMECCAEIERLANGA